jgi:hypothetical protein
MMGQLEFIIGCYRALADEANPTAGGYSKIGAKTNGGPLPARIGAWAADVMCDLGTCRWPGLHAITITPICPPRHLGTVQVLAWPLPVQSFVLKAVT